jgi:hypothetical protein
MIWRAVAASIIDWINSGFNGKPAFITDLSKFMTDIGDQAIGSILQSDSVLSFLCSPFSINVRVALGLTFSKRRAPSCTLTGVMKNIRSFANNFYQGGWPAWFQLTTVDTNNAFGSMLVGEASIQASIISAQGRNLARINWGNGFLSKTEEKCNTDPNTNVQSCVNINVTPGELIARQASDQVGGGQETLIAADEINEIISALVSELLNKALESFSGMSASSGYQDSLYNSGSFTSNLGATDVTGGTGTGNAAVDQITQAVTAEQSVRASNLQAITLLDGGVASQNQVIACWTGKTNTLTDPTSLATAQTQLAAAQTIKNGFITRQQTLATAVQASTANLATLQTLLANATAATTLDTQNTALNAFFAAQATNTFATQGDIAVANGAVQDLQVEMGTQTANAQVSLGQCSALVFTPLPPHVSNSLLEIPEKFLRMSYVSLPPAL